MLSQPVYEEEDRQYIPVLAGKLNMDESLRFLDARLRSINYQVPRLKLAKLYRDGKLPGTERSITLGSELFFDPKDLAQQRFHIRKLQWPTPLRYVLTYSDLKDLAERWGPLGDRKALLAEIKKSTGIDYSPEALKKRQYLKTVMVVGYSGSELRKKYWYPLEQAHVLYWGKKDQAEEA